MQTGVRWVYSLLVSRTATILLIITVGLVAYFPSLFGKFVWDDEDFVYANRYVKEFTLAKFFTSDVVAGRGKVSNYYRPVQLTINATLHALFGFSPFVYHATNIAVHIGATLALWAFLARLTDRRGFALATSLVFLVHPVQTEVVTYISGLSDPLYVLFGFLALTFFLKDRLLASLMFFGLTVLSKETGLVFLGLVGLLALWRKTPVKIIPFLLLAAVYIFFHFSFINKLDVRAAWGSGAYSRSPLLRLSTFAANFPAYLQVMVWPKDLFMERDQSAIFSTSTFGPHWWWFIAVNAAFIVYLVKRRSAALWWWWYSGFWIAFGPYTGIVLINGIWYEHFAYLPLVFFFGFWLWHLPRFSRWWVGLLVVILAAFIVRSWFRQFEWIDPIRFYRQTLIRAPRSLRVINNLGIEYAKRGQYDQAIASYQRAIEVDPTSPHAYHNLGHAYLEQGRLDKAEDYFRRAIEVDPTFHFSYPYLFNIYQQTGQTDKAAEIYARYSRLIRR